LYLENKNSLKNKNKNVNLISRHIYYVVFDINSQLYFD